ncbi:hypothetical protein RF11_09061 [Thelohanellus kitauei]|uniref:MULE transposase domain-containing protein n=1 Tax=Thelohanellus kitauei TaxID=669202 RepID=A0A0C2N314_THEKT|nr:hypothetical protein RF11_09061 [Thelohanellus kitauei]
MVYDRVAYLYILAVYASAAGRSNDIYCTILHQIIVLLEYNWIPSIITSNFELLLTKSIQYEFRDSKLLTLIEHSDAHKTIENIKLSTDHEENLTNFGSISKKTWLQRSDISICNLSNISDVELANRINNSLERYNKRLNDHYANAHPNLLIF